MNPNLSDNNGVQSLTWIKPVNALERGLAVLAVVGKSGRARISDIQEATGLDKATIARMLGTLAHAGYVDKNNEDTSYSITGRTVNLGRGFGPLNRLQELAAPALRAFSDEIGWPCHFAVPDGDAMFIIESISDRSSLLQRVPSDFRPSLVTTSLGIAYLASCSVKEQRRVLNGLVTGTPDSPEEAAMVQDRRGLDKVFAQARKRGYATTDASYLRRMESDAIWDMAVPVTDGKRVYGAVSLFVVRSSLSAKEATMRYLKRLNGFAADLMDILAPESSAFPGGASHQSDPSN